jgi:hypothetical protein
MTRYPKDFSKSVVYKISCKDKNIEYEYVGSTTNFYERLKTHRRDYNNENDKTKYNLKLYKTIRENGNFENWTMTQLEAYSCSTKRELEAREEYWRVELHAQLNMNKAFITDEGRKEHRKQYREQNIEKITEYSKEYREQNKEYFKEKNKGYREQNKEQIKEYDKEYREQNKVKIKEYHKENHKQLRQTEYKCDCGWVGNMASKNYHSKSVKHTKWIQYTS